MKNRINTRRFEVTCARRYNLLGYVYGRSLDHAYDQAAKRYHGLDVVLISTNQQAAA